jgi:hypothetical protein
MREFESLLEAARIPRRLKAANYHSTRYPPRGVEYRIEWDADKNEEQSRVTQQMVHMWKKTGNEADEDIRTDGDRCGLCHCVCHLSPFNHHDHHDAPYITHHHSSPVFALE